MEKNYQALTASGLMFIVLGIIMTLFDSVRLFGVALLFIGIVMSGAAIGMQMASKHQ